MQATKGGGAAIAGWTRAKWEVYASMGRVAAGAAIGSLALVVSAAEVPSDGIYADRIDWGVIADMSGPAAGVQSVWANGFQDYVRELNAAGGVHGRKINVLLEDDRYDATLTRTTFEKLVSQTPVLGISGLGNSSAQVALMPQVRRGKVPIVGAFSVTAAGIEPPTPMYYAGYCGFKSMAQVGVGYFTDTLGLKAPKVAVIHLDVASGKEWYGYVEEAVKKAGGTAKSIPIKINAPDATPQVLELINMKPDFIALHSVHPITILVKRTMQQYGLKIPMFAIAHSGAPILFSTMGPEVASDYYFVACFTPAGADDSPGVKAMAAAADKYGRGPMKEDVNYAAGWFAGTMVSKALNQVGPDPTREKLVASMNKGLEVDTKGVSSIVKYTADDHLGSWGLRPYGYDYQAKRYKAYGTYADYQKYLK